MQELIRRGDIYWVEALYLTIITFLLLPDVSLIICRQYVQY